MNIKFAISLIATIFLSSCGTLPQINCEKARGVHIGMTQAQIVDLLGEPYFVGLSAGVTVFGWQDDEQLDLAKNTLKATINPVTKIVKKVEGSCTQ
ncbi:MAG: hypothetical protein GW936_02135 [Gallionella sp.]|nr:hypothetical protein [Gallionella sp.]